MEPMTNEQLTRLVWLLSGESAAYRKVLTVLIGTHPDPEMLKNTWHQSKAMWIEDEQAWIARHTEDYREAHLKTLGAFSQSIDEHELTTRPES